MNTTFINITLNNSNNNNKRKILKKKKDIYKMIYILLPILKFFI